MATEAEWKRLSERSRRTGTYTRSITHRVYDEGHGMVGVVGTNLPYAQYLEYGTGLYGPAHRWIVPRNAKALRWPRGGGHTSSAGTPTGFQNAPGFRLSGQQRQGAAGKPAQWVYARRVRGIMPRRYARDAAMRVRPQVQRIFELGGMQMARVMV